MQLSNYSTFSLLAPFSNFCIYSSCPHFLSLGLYVDVLSAAASLGGYSFLTFYFFCPFMYLPVCTSAVLLVVPLLELNCVCCDWPTHMRSPSLHSPHYLFHLMYQQFQFLHVIGYLPCLTTFL